MTDVLKDYKGSYNEVISIIPKIKQSNIDVGDSVQNVLRASNNKNIAQINEDVKNIVNITNSVRNAMDEYKINTTQRLDACINSAAYIMSDKYDPSKESTKTDKNGELHDKLYYEIQTKEYGIMRNVDAIENMIRHYQNNNWIPTEKPAEETPLVKEIERSSNIFDKYKKQIYELTDARHEMFDKCLALLNDKYSKRPHIVNKDGNTIAHNRGTDVTIIDDKPPSSLNKNKLGIFYCDEIIIQEHLGKKICRANTHPTKDDPNTSVYITMYDNEPNKITVKDGSGGISSTINNYENHIKKQMNDPKSIKHTDYVTYGSYHTTSNHNLYNMKDRFLEINSKVNYKKLKTVHVNKLFNTSGTLNQDFIKKANLESAIHSRYNEPDGAVLCAVQPNVAYRTAILYNCNTGEALAKVRTDNVRISYLEKAMLKGLPWK